MTIGACVSPSRLAYSLGVEASGLIADKTSFGKVTDVLLDGFQFFFGIWAMKLLGFETEAAEMVAEAERGNIVKTSKRRNPLTSRGFTSNDIANRSGY